MKLQMKGESWQCAVYSYAMATGLNAQSLIELIGHDGGEIVFPHLPEPACRRGHSIFELIDAGIACGFATTWVPFDPHIEASDSSQVIPVYPPERNWQRVEDAIQTSIGIIDLQLTRWAHTVCFAHGDIFDPDGKVYNYDRNLFIGHRTIYQLWRVDRL